VSWTLPVDPLHPEEVSRLARHMLPSFGLLLIAVGCGGEDDTPLSWQMSSDAGVNGGGGPFTGDILPSGAELAAPALPAAPTLPMLLPCADGWRETSSPTEGGATTCDPWPASGAIDCGRDEAHLPGEPSCATVGPTCPPGRWADDLPSDVTVLYVREGAASGGDGSMVQPFATISDAYASATSGAVIAVGRGSYDEPLELTSGVRLWGACAGATHITQTAGAEATIAVRSGNVEIRNLRISGRGVGVQVDPGATASLDGVAVDGATDWAVRVGGLLTMADSVLRNTINDTTRDGAGGLMVTETGTAMLTRVAVEHMRRTGVSANGGTLTMTDSVVRRVQSTEGDDTLGIGVYVDDGGTANLTRSSILDTRYIGLFVRGGSSSTLEDVVIHHTRPAADGDFGFGALVDEASTLTVIRTLVDDNVESGIVAAGEGSTLELTDVVVRETLHPMTPGGNAGGVGVQLRSNARVMGERIAIERASYLGFSVAGADLDVSDLTVLDTQLARDGMTGIGIAVQEGSVGRIDRVRVRNSRHVGLFVSTPATQLTATDVTVTDTLATIPSGGIARGIHVQAEGELTLERAVAERGVGIGMSAVRDGILRGSDVTVRETLDSPGSGYGLGLHLDSGAEVELARLVVDDSPGFGIVSGHRARLIGTDVRISRTWPMRLVVAGLRPGRGLDVNPSGRASLTRAIVEENHEVGVFVSLDAQLELDDVVIRDTRSEPERGSGGVGLVAMATAQAELTFVRLERNAEIGITAWGEDSRIIGKHVYVLDTTPAACGAECPGEGGGIGVGVYSGAVIEIEDFLVMRNHLCGLQIGEEGDLLMRRGLVSDSPIGANIQQEDFPLTQIQDRVRYLRNAVNLDTSMLVVPAPIGSVSM